MTHALIALLSLAIGALVGAWLWSRRTSGVAAERVRRVEAELEGERREVTEAEQAKPEEDTWDTLDRNLRR